MGKNRAAIAGVVMALLAAPALANDAVIDHRKAIMQAKGGHFQASLQILRGVDALEGDREFHAEALVRLAHISEKVFPAGSDRGRTNVRPAIWEQPERFAAELAEFQARSDALLEAALGGDARAYGGAIRNLGASCKSCHDAFKAD